MHVKFDEFEFDLERRVLLHGDAPLHVSPKAFRLLEVLIANAPRAMSKQELTEAVWPQTFVDEGNLSSLVAELRTALGDASRAPRFIRTVHGFGYAFCCDVTPAEQREHAACVVYDGEEIPLYEGVNVMGRDPASRVFIDHATVSRRHASLILDGPNAVLEDLSSKNGTFLDGQRLTAAVPLEDDTTFILGDARVTFRRAGGAGSTLTIADRRGAVKTRS